MKTTHHPFRLCYFACCIFILATIFCFISLQAPAQCTASPTRSPGTAVNDNSIGTVDFLNPSRVFTVNDSRAEADALAVLFSGTTHYLKATNFGFTIDPLASICGITVEIKKRDGGFLSIGTGIRDQEVRLVVNNVITGNNLATSTNWPASPDAFYTYGGASDLWGTTLTPALVNSSNFGVVIAAKFNGIASVLPSAQIDNIRITVNYNLALPTHIVSFNAALKKNTAIIEWQTADEEIGESITLQRATAGSENWEDIRTYDAGIGGAGKKYVYHDPLAQKGNYSYRLRITNNNAIQTYSAIKHINYQMGISLSGYPNPSTDFLTLVSDNAIQNITVSNLHTEKIKLPVVMTGSSQARLDIRRLPKGIYFANVDGQALKFIKN